MPPTVTSPPAATWTSVPVVAFAHCASSARNRSRGWPGDEEAERLLLEGEALGLRPGGASVIRSGGRRLLSPPPSIPKRLDWPCSRSRWCFWPASMARSMAAKRAERRGSSGVEGAALDEALHHPPVHRPEVHALAEVEERARTAHPRGARRAIASTAPSPTFLMAARPKRMSAPRARSAVPSCARISFR